MAKTTATYDEWYDRAEKAEAEVRALMEQIAELETKLARAELPPLSGDVERARDSSARRRPTGPQVA